MHVTQVPHTPACSDIGRDKSSSVVLILHQIIWNIICNTVLSVNYARILLYDNYNNLTQNVPPQNSSKAVRLFMVNWCTPGNDIYTTAISNIGS